MAIAASALGSSALAQTIGPNPRTTTINVTSGTTTVVGGTTVSTGTANASNVTGGTLVWDANAGPSPGSISVQTTSGNALQAAGGTILVPNGGLGITTTGGHAVLANGTNSLVNIANGATISLTGVGAGLVAIGGTIDATGVAIVGSAASSGDGAVAESGGTINLHAGSSITTGGASLNAVALGVSGAGSHIVIDAPIAVTTTGRGAMGIYLHEGGQISLPTGFALNINGNSSVGVAVDNTMVAPGTIGSGLTINLNGTGVQNQPGSTGIVAFNGGNISVDSLKVTGQNAAGGVSAHPDSTITLTGSSVINISSAQNQTFYTLRTTTLATPTGSVGSTFSTTSSSSISGMFARGGTINSTGTTVNVSSGNGAAAANVAAGGLINMDNNTLTTTGASSFGIRVDSGTVVGRNSRVTTSGGGAALFFNAGPGLIDLADTAVLATGATDGLVGLNVSSGMNTVRMSGGSLISEAGTAIVAQGPLDVTTSGTVVTGGGGTLLQAVGNVAGFQPTVLNLTAEQGSRLTGDAIVDAASTANISLLTGSTWTGAASNVTNVDVDATSSWNVTANSTVSQTVANAGQIHFVPPTGDPTELASYKTLTTRNYAGAGGTIGLNTFLGADGSPSDRLIINGGTATGTSRLSIANSGGPGAETTANGIQVVNAINGATTSPGAFTLAGETRAGAFDYDLFRGGINGSAPDDWFLRSTFMVGPLPPAPAPTPTPSPAFVPPVLPADPPPSVLPPGIYPIIGPELATYGVVQPIARQMGLSVLGTLHERVGDVASDASCRRAAPDAPARAPITNAPDVTENICRQAVWGRMFGQQIDNRYRAFADPRASGRVAGIQTGIDVWRGSLIPGHSDTAGVYFAYSNGNVDVNGLVTNPGATAYMLQHTGALNLDSYSFGGYWTHYGPGGWYVDAVVQGSVYDGNAATRSANLQTDGTGIVTSLETGYPIRLPSLGPGFVLEPEAQIVWQQVSFDQAGDGLGPVGLGTTSGESGRLGLRGKWTIADSAGRVWQPYVVANVWQDWGADAATSFGPDQVALAEQATRLEFAGGLSARLLPGLDLYGQAGYQFATASDQRRDGVEGDFGVHYSW